MLKQILKFEARLLRSDGVALLTTGLFLATLAYAGYVGVRYVNEQQGVLDTQTTAYAERMAELKQEAVELEEQMRRDGISLETFDYGARHPYSIGSSEGRVVALSPGPLAAFAVGQSDLQAQTLQVTVAGTRPVGATSTLENPFKLLVGHFDLAFVFLFLFPLLVLALTFGLTSAERETGLLRMLLAQPVPLTTLASGKVLVRAALLLACAVVGSGVVFLAAGAEGGVLRWLLWLVVVIAYGGFWMGLAIFVDSRVKRSVTSALVLAVCWLAFAVILPAVITVMASSLYPVPSRMAYVTAMRTEGTEAQLEGAATLARFFEDHPEITAVDDDAANFAMLRVARDERVAEALAPLEAEFEAQKTRQQRIIRTLGCLSPTVLAQQAFLDIAGTGHARHAAFVAQVEDFHQRWKDHFVPLYFDNVAFRPAHYDALPTFTLDDAHAGGLWGRLVGPLLVLIVVAVLLTGIGFRAYRHETLVG